MKKRTVSILLCMSLLLGIIAGSGVAVSAAQTQAEVVGTTVSNWGAHNYVASDGSTAVSSELTANADGSITVSGNQVSAGMGIGVTNVEPVYLDKGGFSIEFSFDQYDAASGDVWFGLALLDQKTVTNANNPDPVFKGWDNDGSFDPGEGRGMVLIMRPDGDGKLRFQWFYIGVTGSNDATPAANELVYIGDGCYDNLTLDSGNYDNIKLQFIKREALGDSSGGYAIILNEGQYTRNGGPRVDGSGEITPAQPLKLLNEIFPTGTPAYVKLIATNARNADTAFSVKTFNGDYANLENTLDSWGVHNYVAADGSALNSTIEATDTGDVKVTGSQTAGTGELGVTYARPIDMSGGFSIEFSLDEYCLNGVDGADSWIALQIKDNLTVTDANNTDPVYHMMDVGGGDPAYGSGLHILMRPGADNVLTIQEIYYCGLERDTEGKLVASRSWRWDGNGCYSQIKLDSFARIKISFVPNGYGYRIVFNDGDFEPVNNPNPNPGYINLANGYADLRSWFDFSTPAYVSLSYKCNKEQPASFTVHSVNGRQAVANTADSWGAHNFTALDGSYVISNTAADETGSLVVSGNQTAGHGAIGATWKRPIDMSEGISVEFSLDEYSFNGVNGVDTWMSLELLHQQIIADSWNPDGAYRHFEVGNPTYGDGLVMLLRPLEGNRLGIGEIYINGAQVDGTVVSGAFSGVTNGGCYDTIQVDSFRHIKIEIIPTGLGSFDIVFNDGDYIRVGADRWANDHGRINVAEGFSWMSSFFSKENPAYLKLAYKCSAGIPAQFTVHKVNGIPAVPAAEDAPEIEVTDGIYELLSDRHFENGFKVYNMGGAEKNDPTVGYLNYGNPALIPNWSVAQWETRYDFRDLENDTLFMELDDGVYEYDSIDKIFTIDTNTGTLGMELNASEVYDDPRQEGEGWPHLLIEGSTVNREAPFASRLKNVNHLRLSLSQRLTEYTDCMGDTATGLHGAAFYIYLYVKGINEEGKSEMTWFGLTLFDNRVAFVSESGQQDGGKADASGLFIYQVPSRAFTKTDFVENGVITPSEDGEWMNIDIDVLPYVERALILAQERGFMKGVTMDTVTVDGMNMGWEMPGTYNGRIEVKDLSLKSYVGTTYELNNGIYNLSVAHMEDTETVTVDENLTLNVPRYLVDMDGIDESMLIIQSGKRDTTEGVSVEGYDIRQVYDLGVWINGDQYDSPFDNELEIVYKPDSGDVVDLRFFAVSPSGKVTALDGVYDGESNTFTCSLRRAAALAVAVVAPEQPEDPIPGTGETSIAAAVCLMLTAVCGCALLTKKHPF